MHDVNCISHLTRPRGCAYQLLRGWSVLASGIWLVWSSRRMHEVAVLVRVSQAAERRIARGESGNRVASGQVGLN